MSNTGTTWLLVAFFEEKGYQLGQAMHKHIKEADYRLLMEDFQVDVELKGIPHQITSKRSFSVNIADCQHLVLVIDVKKKVENK